MNLIDDFKMHPDETMTIVGNLIALQIETLSVRKRKEHRLFFAQFF